MVHLLPVQVLLLLLLPALSLVQPPWPALLSASDLLAPTQEPSPARQHSSAIQWVTTALHVCAALHAGVVGVSACFLVLLECCCFHIVGING
jgi:hypothetical protein